MGGDYLLDFILLKGVMRSAAAQVALSIAPIPGKVIVEGQKRIGLLIARL